MINTGKVEWITIDEVVVNERIVAWIGLESGTHVKLEYWIDSEGRIYRVERDVRTAGR